LTALSAYDDIGVNERALALKPERRNMGNIRTLCRSAIFILTLSGFFGPRCGATVYHSNGTAESVQFFHDNQAQNGDTITLPAGIFAWTTGVVISKAITLQGAGVGSTILRDNVSNGQMINITVPANGLVRLTGIEFQDGGHGGRGQYANDPGLVNAKCSDQRNGAQFRFDHNKWNMMDGNIGINTVLGVADNNTFLNGQGNGYGAFGCFTIYGTNYNGQPNGYDYSWHDPANFGSANFFFIEDNTFTNSNGTYQGFVTDAYAGARFVIRHNHMSRYNGASDHGTESVGRTRGGRAYEFYNNTIDGNVNYTVCSSRSGTILVHDNTFVNFGGWSPPKVNLSGFRNFYSFSVWGGADGTSPWDINSPTVYFTGSAASASSGLTVTVSGSPSWTVNQWKGYVIRRTNSGTNPNFCEIQSNTANAITYRDAGGYAANLSFNAGDSIEIRKVIQQMDVSGRGQGSVLPNVQNLNPPAGWNDQVTDPSYIWNNNVAPAVVSDCAAIRLNEHYFVGTAKPGYTSYVYPHPLVTDPPMPSPTPSATVTPSPTATATATATATVTATATATSTPPLTPTPTPTSTPIATPTPTATPRHTPKPHPSHGPYQG